MNLIQYTQGQTRKVHLKMGSIYSESAPSGSSSITACGRELGVTLRRYKIWRGHPEEVDCGLCKRKMRRAVGIFMGPV
jgi:hypothetical protein